MATNLDAKFEQFHGKNPEVYRTIVGLAREALKNGKNRLGIRMLWEVTRWTLIMSTETTDYKLNDQLTSRYARPISELEPDLAGIFELRRLRS